MYFYRRLRDLREDHDLVQKEVAAHFGIDQRVYSNYETGKRGIPVHLLLMPAELYETSVNYLLGRTDYKAPLPVSTKSRADLSLG